MAPVLIPTRNDLDDYSLAVELDGASFQLRFVWNTRDARWMMDIRSGDGVDLRNGIPLVVNTPLNGRFAGGGLPEGYLIALDTSGQYREIVEQEDFSERVKLMYVPAEDI